MSAAVPLSPALRPDVIVPRKRMVGLRRHRAQEEVRIEARRAFGAFQAAPGFAPLGRSTSFPLRQDEVLGRIRTLAGSEDRGFVQPIAESDDGLQRRAEGSELLPQSLDVGVDRARFRVAHLAPNAGDERFPIQRAIASLP